MQALLRELPVYDYVYFGDTAHAPYGPKSQEEIFRLTRDGVKFLFEKGCPFVLLACNTASSQALRRIQRKFLSTAFPDRRVLGVIAPTVEQVTKSSARHIGIVATEATVDSGAYVREMQKRNPLQRVTQIACPLLAPAIDRGASEAELRVLVETSLAPFSKIPDVLILGCTHYEHIKHLFEAAWPSVPILGQSAIVASSFKNYLARHPEIEKRLTQGGTRHYFSSGIPVSELPFTKMVS